MAAITVLHCLAVWGTVEKAWGQGSLTVGTLMQTEESFNGYTLLPINQSKDTYLINNCGEEVNRWTSEYIAGKMAYMLDDGSLLRTGDLGNPLFGAGGRGGVLEHFDWDGNLLWSFEMSSSTMCQHHDIAVMPNGHILALLWKSYPGQVWMERGRNPELTSDVVWGTCVIEIDPFASDGGAVVWQWEVFNHLVQNFDPQRANYGDPALHPGRLDVNYQAAGTDKDWLHTNSLAYNPELDQIMISSRDFNEIWILDHSVEDELTSSQLGDLVYRWGNPEAYGRGDAQGQMLFGQHDARWIEGGQIMVFSNGNGRPEGPYSTVEVFTPPLLSDGSYSLGPYDPWGPVESDWRYPEEFDPEFFALNSSGAHPLPNGNVLITEGGPGQLREINSVGDIVWSYVNPIGFAGSTPQGMFPSGNAVFRATRYSADHPGLAGRDLPGLGVLEITNTPVTCTLYPEETCALDLDHDYLIDVDDLLLLLSSWGCLIDCPGDGNGDGSAGVADLLLLLVGLGETCSGP